MSKKLNKKMFNVYTKLIVYSRSWQPAALLNNSPKSKFATYNVIMINFNNNNVRVFTIEKKKIVHT